MNKNKIQNSKCISLYISIFFKFNIYLYTTVAMDDIIPTCKADELGDISPTPNSQSIYNYSPGMIYSPDSLTADNMSTRSIYEYTPSEYEISRPVSRNSLPSSITATKDGVEGSKIRRNGIPQYPLNLLNVMAHSQYKKHKQNEWKLQSQPQSASHSNNDSRSQSHIYPPEDDSDDISFRSLTHDSNFTFPDYPTSPPMTLRDKMKLLKQSNKHLLFLNKSIDSFDDSQYADSDYQGVPSYSTENILYARAKHKDIDDLVNAVADELPEINTDPAKDSYILMHTQPLLERDLHISHPSGRSELDSNASTAGDDFSYIFHLRNLHSPVPIIDAGNDS